MTRKPAVSGMFYESRHDELKRQIKKAFLSEFGPKVVPGEIEAKEKAKIFAGIVPHAGYPFSAACAAHFYLKLSASEKPDCFLVLGTDHTGAGNCMSDEDFETPFGLVKIDKELLDELKKQGIPVDNGGHKSEHSIEVQLPFLQYIYGEETPPFVPLIVGDCEGLSGKIAAAISSYGKGGKHVCIIASSDFTHYGFNYGFVPFSEDEAAEEMPKLDKGAIDFIINLDVEHFVGYVEDTGATICGFNSIATLLEIMKQTNPGVRTKLLKYYTSGDITKDYSNAVGYGCIVFSK